ncbi:MAG TPA: LysM domain-containing protein [Thermodesulfobacteriota bacterium]
MLTLEERLAEGASPEAAETIEEVVDYTVVPGDTLWDIARRFTRNPFRYREIASDNDLRNPHLIFPGQRLTLRIRRLVPAPSPSP